MTELTDEQHLCNQIALPRKLLLVSLRREPLAPNRPCRGADSLYASLVSQVVQIRLPAGDFQNRRTASCDAVGGFDPHSLPPFIFNSLPRLVRHSSPGQNGNSRKFIKVMEYGLSMV